MRTVKAGRQLRRAFSSFIALAAVPASALASTPEQLEQLEPDGGEWQFEYSTLLGVGSEDEHSFQMLRGISDHLAIGVEVEAEYSAGTLEFEGVAPTVLYRFSDASDRVGVGIAAQVQFDGDLSMVSAEARLIVEKKTRFWWGQGNLIARRVREERGSESVLAYGWGLSRSIGSDLWIGAEGSGGLVRLDGHFVGPSFSAELEIGSSELEIGVAWLHRVSGEGLTRFRSIGPPARPLASRSMHRL